MWTKLAWCRAYRSLRLGVIAALITLPTVAGAQPKEDEEFDEVFEPDETADEADDELASEPETPPPPPPAAPAAPPPSPFTFVLRGMIAGTMYMQDVPMSGNGGTAIFGPSANIDDKWLLSGDIRQSRLMFTMKGPEVLGGGTPTGVMEFDLGGGHQLTSVPAGPPLAVRDAMGAVVGTVTSPVLSSAQGDESLLPRVRVAYVELNWGMGQNILRVGQFHNLLLPMIPASASHTGTPLGYGAGQLGWRSPGITYLHKLALSADMNLDIGVQINRNSWIDNRPVCAPTATPPSCLPSGVSLGEASLLPQFEGRVMLSGGKAPSPWPLYAPNVWQVYLVGHWDQKDVSGVGPAAPPTAMNTPAPRDGMHTLAGEFGFKLHVGPILVAGNGWVGKNSGNVYGNILQMQESNMPDVNGFGGWGQLGFSVTPEISVWAFGGIDKPNRGEAQNAGLTRVQNVQLAGMLAYVEGPIIVGLEYLYLSTDSLITLPPPPGTMSSQIYVANATGNQLALTLSYMF